jgi:hypothetical protein
MKKLFAGSLMALGVASANISAAPTVQVEALKGGTTLYFSNLLLGALDAAGVAVADVQPARLNDTKPKIRFPLAGGVLDLDGTIGEINHLGGLKLACAGGLTAVLHNFFLEAGSVGIFVSGVVELNGSIVERTRLFEISHDPDDVKVDDDGRIRARRLNALLTAEAAELLALLDVSLEEGNKAGVLSSNVRTLEPEDDSDDSDSDDSDSDDSDSDDSDSDDSDSDDSDSDDSDSDDSDSDDSDST